MESLTEKIKRFLSLDSGYGSGSGSGYGTGSGTGSGSGYGDGDGSGYGYGDGDGSGDGIIQYIQYPVYYVDGVETLIYNVCRNVAHGAVLNSDLTLSDCVIVRDDRHFAHRKTLSKAMDALREKAFDDMDEDERVSAFLDAFPDPDKPIPNKELYDWHHRLTGSCEMGRDLFVTSRGIDMNEMTTVRDFCDLVKDSYGGEVIRMVIERYGEEDGDAE